MSREPFEKTMIFDARNRLARRMVELRHETNLSQNSAAALAGMSLKSWSRIENRKNSPTLDSLLRIEYALGVDSLEALFGRTTGDLFGHESAKLPAKH
jgi:transcriptional regulator with XRE-family HTH domain